MYVIPSYLSVLKLQNYSSECSICAFFREIEEKLFWVIEAINKASPTSSIMNLSHTLYVVANEKKLCIILSIQRVKHAKENQEIRKSYLNLHYEWKKLLR